MNKYIIGAIIFGIGLIGFLLLNTDSRSTNNTDVTSTADSKISVVEQPYDFGDIDIFGGKVNTSYTLKNEGAKDVTITRAVTSCMCTEGEIAGLTFGMHGSEVKSVVIPAGRAEKVTAIYDPLAHGPNGTGPVTRTLQLETNSTETPKIELRFSANVIKNEG